MAPISLIFNDGKCNEGRSLGIIPTVLNPNKPSGVNVIIRTDNATTIIATGFPGSSFSPSINKKIATIPNPKIYIFASGI